MAAPPYNIDATSPSNSMKIAQFPANERTFRDIVKSWLTQISDPTTGNLKTSAFGSGGLTLTSDDAGATAGPVINLDRTSPSPAVSDVLGQVNFRGRTSTDAAITYAFMRARIADPTNASPDGILGMGPLVDGSLGETLTLTGTGASIVGALSVSGNLTLGGSLTTGSGLNITGGIAATGSITSDSQVVSNGTFRGSPTVAILGTFGPTGDSGTVYIRPNGYNSETNQTTVNSSGNMSVSGSVSVAGNVVATGTVTASSDDAVKDEWLDPEPGLIDRLALVRAGTYHKDGFDGRELGVSAQSLAEVMPEAVIEVEFGEDQKILTVAYGNAALVAAIELAKRVIALERRLGA